jgi:hypothetical protein
MGIEGWFGKSRHFSSFSVDQDKHGLYVALRPLMLQFDGLSGREETHLNAVGNKGAKSRDALRRIRTQQIFCVILLGPGDSGGRYQRDHFPHFGSHWSGRISRINSRR